MSKDYYNILGVDKSASQDDIKKAFRKKAHELHPDKKGGDEKKFKEANEAYQVLGDANRRSKYDQFGSGFENGQAGGAGGFGGFGGFDGANINMDDLGDMFGGFGDIFGFGGGSRGGSRNRRGSDIEASVTINFSEAVFGVKKEVMLRKKNTCDKCKGEGAEPGSEIKTCNTCNGSGKVSRVQRTILGNIQTQTVCHDCHGEGKIITVKCSKCFGAGVVDDNSKISVKIPAGIDNNQSIRLAGQGEAGEKGSQAGDLYLRINVKSDKRFERDGFDIHSKVYIKFTQAALGDKLDVETIDGPVKLKIPEGTESGTLFRLKAKGVTRLQSRGRGDHIVKVAIKTPKGLNRSQKKVLEELGV